MSAGSISLDKWANAQAISAIAASGSAHASIDLGVRQSEFADALLDSSQPIPGGLTVRAGADAKRRFAIYRNNVVTGLMETLKDAFPAVKRLIGEECFTEVARLYAAKHLPQSPVMHEYGNHFADFLAALAPLNALPYLPDVARLEHAWLQSYHSPDRVPVDRSRLGAIPAHALPEARFLLHPSIRIVRSQHEVVKIWRMNIEAETFRTLVLDARAEDAFVIRPQAEVEVRALPPGAALFMEALQAGDSLSAASDRALNGTPNFDLARAIGGLIQSGAIVGWQLHGEKFDGE